MEDQWVSLSNSYTFLYNKVSNSMHEGLPGHNGLGINYHLSSSTHKGAGNVQVDYPRAVHIKEKGEIPSFDFALALVADANLPTI